LVAPDATAAGLDVLTGGLGVEMSRITRGDKLRVLHILKGFGCTVVPDTAHKGMTVTIPDVLLKVSPSKTTVTATPAPLSAHAWVSGKPNTETH
jgi:hypothetical protein